MSKSGRQNITEPERPLNFVRITGLRFRSFLLSRLRVHVCDQLQQQLPLIRIELTSWLYFFRCTERHTHHEGRNC
jgi:hypothetical protein